MGSCPDTDIDPTSLTSHWHMIDKKKVIVVVYYSSQSGNGTVQGSSSLDIKNSSSWDELF